jgi:hypothetical protein
MTVPIKKPNQIPESYSPKKPEIAKMMKQAGMENGDINNPANKNANGTSGIDYNFEFSPFWGRNFNNCFSSAYKYLTLNDDQYADVNQCDLFFYFGTMSGQNVTRLPYDESSEESEWLINNTKTQIDLIFGFSWYDYKVITDNLKSEIIKSINAKIPVIAKLKEQNTEGYNLIIAYDGDNFLCPNYSDDPKHILTYDKIDALYIFGDKKTPRYTFMDGLKQIKKVLDHSREKGYWTEFITKFNHYWEEGLNNADISEVKKRFERTANVMCHTFNCHNFGEAMGKYKHSLAETMKNNEHFKHTCDLISDACFSTHLNAWIPIEINKLIDWEKENRDYNSEWALGNAVARAIKDIDYYDKMLLEAINEMIEILSGRI